MAAPDDDAWKAALHSDDPLHAVTLLLENGASPNADDGDGTFWPLLARVLKAAARAPRWCPVPVVTVFLKHGANVQSSTNDDDYDHAGHILAVWRAVLALPKVHGPRRRQIPDTPGTPGSVLRHDHCRHVDNPSCALACARLLLRHGANPHVRGVLPGDPTSSTTASAPTSLAMLALAHPRRPVELLQSLGLDGPAALYPLLDRALTDALRIDSLRRLPRGRRWDCYPPPAEAVRVRKPDAVVRFLLARGAFAQAADRGSTETETEVATATAMAVARLRTRMILDRWDPDWERFTASRGRWERESRGY